MKNNGEKKGGILDYAIGILTITILMLATFLMPQGYSALMDSKDLNQVHVVEREDFSFKSPVDLAVRERIQQMMENIIKQEALKRTLYLSGQEVTDRELLAGIREAMRIAAQYNMLPDISSYDIEGNIVYAEYYNLSDSTAENAESTEIAFWNIRFSDYETFDFTFRVDASEYIIYQAELYCAEAADYVTQLMSDDKEVTAFLNGQFIEGCEFYLESEGYDVMTEITYGDMALMLGYERREYAVYRAHCTNGYIDGDGIRWGFVPMTIALEKGNSAKDWGYKGIEGYYGDLFHIDIYEEEIIELK